MSWLIGQNLEVLWQAKISEIRVKQGQPYIYLVPLNWMFEKGRDRLVYLYLDVFATEMLTFISVKELLQMTNYFLMMRL